MRTTTTRSARSSCRPVVTGLVGVTLLALTACGGSAPRSAAAGDTAAAASSAGGAPTPATTSPAGSGSPARTPSAGELTRRVASAVKAKGTAALAMSSGSTGQHAAGAMRYKNSGVDFAMTMALPGGKSMKMVVVDGTAYMDLGQKYQGKNWIRIAPGGADPLSKALGPVLTQLRTGLDLDHQLAGVKEAKITSATRATLGGTPVTKYTVVSDEKALLAQLDEFAPSAAVRDSLRSQFKGAHAESVMWIGDDNLPRRVDSRVVGGKTPGTTTTVTYSDWGKPVSISAPRSSDTVNLAG